MPEGLFLPLIEPVRLLSIMNSPLPNLDEETMALAESNVFYGVKCGHSESAIREAIKTARIAATEADNMGIRDPLLPEGESAADILEKAVANYQKEKCFSHYDWRLKSWGTVEDIIAVDEDSFATDSLRVTFETAWTPPVAALQILANTFPSVRFELEYHINADDPLITIEFFPFPPFGY